MEGTLDPATVELTTSESKSFERLRNAKAFIFDMDGVLYRGNEPLSGAKELFDALELRGVPYSLATNNSTLTPEAYVVKLAKMGLKVPASSILTSGIATRDAMLERIPAGSPIYVLGADALREVLYSDGGYRPADMTTETPAAVVVGLDRDFTYQKLFEAHHAIQKGAEFIATNADVTLPTELGLVPGCGSLIAAVQASTGVTPTLIGKPEPTMLFDAAKHLGVNPQDCVMVGDRLDTDIVSANRAGMLSVMVLTGVSSADEILTSGVVPDLVFTDLDSVVDAYTGSW